MAMNDHTHYMPGNRLIGVTAADKPQGPELGGSG